MKKMHIIKLFIMLVIIFLPLSVINAEPEDGESQSNNENEYGTYDDADKCSDGSDKDAITFNDSEYCYSGNTGVYCSSATANDIFDEAAFPVCFYIYKDTAQYNSTYDLTTIETSLAYNGNNYEKTQFMTIPEDPIAFTPGKWWKSVRLCYDVSLGLFDSSSSFYVYSDSLLSVEGDDKNFLWYPTERSGCRNYSVRNVPAENMYTMCSAFYERQIAIKQLIEDYNDNHKSSSINEYKILLSELEGLCSKTIQYSDYNDSCVSVCLYLNDYRKEWDNSFGISTGGTKCGFSVRLISWIMNILKWIKFIIPVVVIIFGVLDFIKATGSNKDDDMKKAQGNFVKRLIAATLIFLVPLLIEFILPKFGLDYNSCGIF